MCSAILGLSNIQGKCRSHFFCIFLQFFAHFHFLEDFFLFLAYFSVIYSIFLIFDHLCKVFAKKIAFTTFAFFLIFFETDIFLTIPCNCCRFGASFACIWAMFAFPSQILSIFVEVWGIRGFGGSCGLWGLATNFRSRDCPTSRGHPSQ